MAERSIVVEAWEKQLLCAGMEPTQVALLAERFRDLEDGPAKWAAIADWLVREQATPELAVEPERNGKRHPTIAALRAENDALCARVAELEQRMAGGADAKERS